MRKLILLLFLFGVLGCERREMMTDCGVLRCPTVISSIFLSIVDVNGEPAVPAYIETYNVRTQKKEVIVASLSTNPGATKNKYKLFGNPRDFSSNGDQVTVLVRSANGKEFKLEYLIKGGNCTCETEKVSGPTLLTVD